MSLGTNIQIYRKKKELTQENLADMMGVSRQTISKWESDTAYPETDKLITLSDMFGCTVDTLIKGDAEEDFVADTTGYDKEANSFTKAICAGTATVLFGLSAMLFMFGLFGIPEEKYTAPFMTGIAIGTFLLFVAIGAAIFIVGGIRHGNFVKENPLITPFYKAEEIKAFKRKFPVYIAVATLIVFLGLIALVVCSMMLPVEDPFKEQFEVWVVSFFMMSITVAAPIYIYAGMQYCKYDIESYNKAYNKTPSKYEKISGAVSGSLMIIATIIFLILGLVFNMWKICWIAYPVAALLCGVSNLIFDAMDKKE
ncbi:MAG: helix-turn-helix transcriptional regulator [Ruminococcaceae bacterium]|nr:helix-turn-helix transcriptional regulator [Oscillospiraceae bacterium]